jgi:hypothetical protein
LSYANLTTARAKTPGDQAKFRVGQLEVISLSTFGMDYK